MLRLSTKGVRKSLALLENLSVDEKAEVFQALGDPVRLKIVILLCQQKDLCVTDIAELLGASLPLISHHLRLLKEAGIVEVIRMGKMLCYSLADPRIKRFVKSKILNEGG